MWLFKKSCWGLAFSSHALHVVGISCQHQKLTFLQSAQLPFSWDERHAHVIWPWHQELQKIVPVKANITVGIAEEWVVQWQGVVPRAFAARPGDYMRAIFEKKY